MLIKIQELIDDAKCYETIRELRWPAGVHCPHCSFHWITKRGFHTNQAARQRSICHSCEQQFDDLTGTPLAGHHQPVKIWMMCLSFMGLNLSNQQIAQELDLNKADVHEMTTFLRQAIHAQRKPPLREGEVEFDEVYIVAGPKGQPTAVQAAGRSARRGALWARLKAKRGRGTLATEKPPVLGMIQRTGQLIIELLPHVQQKTIQPLIPAHVQAGALIYTDEYNSYGRLAAWGFDHKTVNPSLRAFARDEDGDGFQEVHTNTIEGVWSLLRAWLRPHRGISQDKLPLYLAFFEFVHNVRQRGKALLASLLSVLVAPCNPD